ncbi:MAG: winged helix-turn-helix transcriptional regulator [Candidatus Thorarchaeota archaeon]
MPSLLCSTCNPPMEVTTLKISVALDEDYTKILSALQEARKKVTTSQLSEKLGIPERTVRYRLEKLRKKGLLRPPKIQTYERKIGLGERLLLLQGFPDKEERLVQVLEELPLFYYYAPTYGRYDGYVAHVMYPLVAPGVVLQLAEEMKDSGLVQDFYIFDLVDYCRKGAAVAPLLSDSDWDWDVWTDEITRIMEEGCDFELGLEQFPPTVAFKFKDIRIIQKLVDNPTITLKEVAKQLGLSLALVHKRVKRLEEEGIIRGIKPTFNPFEETITIGCFFKSAKHAKEILCGFHSLPYEVSFSLENDIHYEVLATIPPSETNQLLRRLNTFRRYTEEFFIQVVLKGRGKGFTHLLDAYNKETNSWEMPITDMLAKVRELAG